METPPIRFVTTRDGYRIAYIDAGTGQPFVFMPHPFSDVEAMWSEPSIVQPWLHGLKERFRLIAFDARGQGASTRGLPSNVTMDDFDRDLIDLVDTLNLHRFILMAQTYSAISAIRYAATHQDRIHALILAASSVRMDARSPAMYHEFPAQDWDAFVYRSIPPGTPMDEVQRLVPRLRRAITQADWVARSSAYLYSDTSDLLPTLRIPALVLHPRKPSALSPDESRKLASLIPGGRLVLIDGAAPPGDATTGLAAIDEFLSSVAPVSPIATGPLSPREREVLKLVAEGRTNPQIAEQLVISLNTVQRHVSSILEKTGAHNRTEAAGYAHRNQVD
jgi:pimeloyl-ACP methyl ester carboxylesterase/DNA-binding CsgD family transcriptional regulator